jgi:hypothetical protein
VREWRLATAGSWANTHAYTNANADTDADSSAEQLSRH